MSELPVDPSESVAFDGPIELASPDSNKVQLMVIGSKEGVKETIQDFDQNGIAGAGAWSDLIPTPDLNEVISILTFDYNQEDGTQG